MANSPTSSPRVSVPEDPSVVIVMCTFNGHDWLQQQLESIAAQDHRDWVLCVSDDGSTDDTLRILQEFSQDHPVQFCSARQPTAGLTGVQRATENYLQTLCDPALPLGPDSLVALSDQDDIWRPDKLSHARSTLAAKGRDDAAIYAGQSCHISAAGQPLAFSRPPRRPVGFSNAVLQNVVSGHSVVLTPAALRLLRAAGVPKGLYYHDWWIYLLMAAVGADIIVDDHVGLDYRQHNGNVMGAGQGVAARLKRLRQIADGSYGTWMRANLAALNAVDVDLLPEVRSSLTELSAPRIRPSALRRAGAYRQSAYDTACVYGAAALGRL